MKGLRVGQGWGVRVGRTNGSSQPEKSRTWVVTLPKPLFPQITPLYSLLLALEVQRGRGSQVPKRLPWAVQVAQGSESIALQWPRAAWRGRREGPREGGQFPKPPSHPRTWTPPTPYGSDRSSKKIIKALSVLFPHSQHDSYSQCCFSGHSFPVAVCCHVDWVWLQVCCPDIVLELSCPYPTLVSISYILCLFLF